MDPASQRVNVTLDAEHAEKLSRLARRIHVQEGTLARSLLATAIDEADPDPASVTALLDGLNGAYERAIRGRDDALAGRTHTLDEL